MGPDLTVGTNRFAEGTWGGFYPNRTNSYNLGPTGMRGWIYTSWYVPPTSPYECAGNIDSWTSDNPWQILVTTVGTGTPAYGKLFADDVIIGVQAGGGTVPLFTNDARISLGWAICEAEATNGVLRVLVNRYGVPTNQTYSLQLGLSNLAYSATAPYNCPKSARILADAVKVISNMTFSFASLGNPVLGLAKMAVGITNASLKTYANSAAPLPGSMSPYAEGTWDWGYRNIFLAEYFMLTGDTSVTNGIRELAINSARATDLFGMVGHGGCENHNDGTYNGAASGYGPMHASSLAVNMGIVLSKKCGIAAPELDPAIVRYNTFLNYHVDKGMHNYGAHETFPSSHTSNGKGALSALYLAFQGNQPTPTEYFTRMEVGNYNGRAFGHTGQGFSFMWGGLGANVGGTNALASYLAQIYWQLDLFRRYNGSFVYDGDEQGGNSPNISDYWYQPGGPGYGHYNGSYADMEPTCWHVLLNSVPSRRLYITGKNPNPTNTLSATVVSNAMWAGMYSRLCYAYTTNQLLSHFTDWDPVVRVWAANELARRPDSNTMFNLLVGMTTSNDAHVRWSACQTLRMMKMTNAVPTYAKLMYDTDVWVRTLAAWSLRDAGAPVTVGPYMTNMMAAIIKYGTTNTFDINEADPLQIATRWLLESVFYQNSALALTKPTNLLYQAVAVGLAHPDSIARCNMVRYDEYSGNPYGFLDLLNWTQVQILAPSIVQCAMEPAPANRMFGPYAYVGSIGVLAKYRVEEGIPLCIRYLDKCMFWGYWGNQPYTVLTNLSAKYRGSAKEAVSSMEQWKPYVTGADGGGPKLALLNIAINSITNDLVSPVLTNFKTIAAVSATPTILTLPTSNVTLSCFVTDIDGGIPSYTWSKTQGAGTVTFSTNSSTAASNCTATFSAPGTYVIRMACVDKSILNDTTWKWTQDPNWLDLKTATNILGAVYTNITVTVYGQPYVNITNADFSVNMTVAQVQLGGTNNTHVVGGMQLTSVANGATNYTASIPAGTPWTIMVSNLMHSATNVVTMTVTNGMGVVTNDTVRIYRPPLAFLQVTNIPGNYIVLPSSSNTWRVAGTNNVLVVGGMVWTNAAIGGGTGIASPGSGNWSFNVALVLGFNVITINGTNAAGDLATDRVTIVKGMPPMIDITNLTTASTILVPSTTASQYVAGTNSSALAGGAGGFRWTNTLSGATNVLTRPDTNSWYGTATLNYGLNPIIVYGTNTAGAVVADTVSIYRATAPYVDITNANRSVSMNVTSLMIGGTNNAAAVGGMQLTNVAGGTTRYTASIPAATPWSLMVTNLSAGMTNFVTMTVSNIVGQSSNDTVQIYRRPLALLDITNISGQIVVPATTTAWRVAGTNNNRIVGGMVWTNSLGGDGTLGAAAGNWSFDTPIAMGPNVITVYGTNVAGDEASDSVTIITKGLSFTNGLSLWLDAARIPGLTDGQQVDTWTDMSGAGNHASLSNGSPKYTTNMLNGLPVVRFGGTDNMSVNLAFLANNSYHIFVIEGKSAAGGMYLLTTYPQSANRALHVGYRYDNDFTLAQWGNDLEYVNASLAYPPQVFRLWEAGLAKSYGHYIFLNGAQAATNANTTPLSTADNGLVGTSFNGDIAEILIYSNALSAAEQKVVGAYLADKYGLTTSYPTGFQATMLTFGPGAVISGTNIDWTVPYTPTVTNLAPTYVVSAWASCDIPSGATTDFSSPVTYTVLSGDSATSTAYTVTVTVTPVATGKDILTFGPGAVINGNQITWIVPPDADVTMLAPAYTMSQFATGYPASGATTNFTTPQTYTIVAQDLSTNIYTVTAANAPQAVITNVAGMVVVPTNIVSYYLAGTNNATVVGGLTWTNSLGGGGTLVLGVWNFTAPLAMGNNIITVSGTNAYGTVASASVSIIRSAGTLQMPIPDGLGLWLDASQLSGLVAGAQVDTWTDMSGAGNHAALLAGSPKYETGMVNGRPVVRFVGGDSMNVNLSFIASNSYHIFLVEGRRAAGGMYMLTTSPTAQNQGLHIGYRNDTTFTLAQWANDIDYGNASLAYTTQVFRTWEGRLNRSSGHYIFLNGTQMVANANTTPLITADNGLITYNGDIAEILIYTNVLTAGQVAALNDYLAAKYTYPPPPYDAKIVFFGIPGFGADIAGTNIAWNLPSGTAVTNLAPTFAVSPWAACDKVSGSTNNFSSPILYTVISADTLVTNVYTATATLVAPHIDITNGNFSVSMHRTAARIGGTNNAIHGPVGMMDLVSVTGGTTNYTASISAATAWTAAVSNLVPNATNVVTISGTNVMGVQAVDTIMIMRPAIVPASIYTWTNTVSGIWSDSANWTNEHGAATEPAQGGQADYVLNFYQASTYTANNDLGDNFLLNQLNFGGPVLTLAGNSMVLTNNGAAMPQVNQNSAARVSILNSIELGANTVFGGTSAGTVVIVAAVAGDGTLTKTGPGTLIFGSANTYTNTTTISGGILKLGVSTAPLILDTSVLHIDASSLATGTVTTLANTGTGGGTFTVDSGSVTVAADIKGRNALRFTGVNAFKSTDAYVNAGSVITIFSVASSAGTTSNSAWAGYLSFNRGGLPSNSDWNDTRALAALGIYTTLDQFGPYRNSGMSGITYPMPSGPATPFITVQVFDGTNSTFALIDSLGALGNATPVASAGAFDIGATAIGGRLGANNSLGNLWNGDVGEVLVFNGVLSESHKTEIQDYLKYKWFGIGGEFSLPMTNTQLTIGPGGTFDVTLASLYTMAAENTYTFGLDATSAGLIRAAGLNISNAVVNVNGPGSGPAFTSVYILATYTTLAGANFATVNNQPWNSSINYTYGSGSNQIALILGPRPVVDITNIVGTALTTNATQWIYGTNNFRVVGRMAWTNSLGGNGNFLVGPAGSPTGWAFNVTLQAGNNVISVYGTNTAGYCATDVVSVFRTVAPFVDITNATITVGMGVAQTMIGGTNNAAVAGGLWLTSVAGGATNYTASIPAATPWTALVGNLVPGATNVVTINGALGGTRIDVHLPNPANHFDMTGDGWTAGSVRNYGRILTRVANAKLTHGIRGHFWHQGENNSGTDAPDDGYDYQFYQQYFVDMAAALKEDFPNLKYYYLFQVYPYPCGMGPKGDQIREVQRTLPRMFSPRMQIMSTVGNQPPVGCHTTRAGYLMFANLIGPLVKQDMYGYVPSTPITAPDVKSVSFTSTNKTAITLVFGQDVIWKNSATNLFYLDYQAGKVASGSVASNVVTLQLTAPTTNTTITYVNAQTSFDVAWTNWMIYGSNGIAALTFSDVPIQTLQPPVTNMPSDVQMFVAGQGTTYGQVSLSWSNGAVTVLACTNRMYGTNASYWFVLATGVSTPWTHTAASNFPSVYYRIVSGGYTSQYDVGKFDVDIAPGSIAWMSFPFGVQLGCDVLSEWFGTQLEPRPYTGYNFPSIQKQATPGGTIVNADYYINDFGDGKTNWYGTSNVVANAGYILFLPRNHGAIKVTGIGMVQTNNVTMQIPYSTIPWVGLAYDVTLDMRNSGLTNLFTPAKLYSSFNYDYADSQQTLGGSIWSAEYYIDDWGSRTTNFFPSVTGADKLEPGKGYLIFFSTTRSGTGVWNCIRPY